MFWQWSPLDYEKRKLKGKVASFIINRTLSRRRSFDEMLILNRSSNGYSTTNSKASSIIGSARDVPMRNRWISGYLGDILMRSQLISGLVKRYSNLPYGNRTTEPMFTQPLCTPEEKDQVYRRDGSAKAVIKSLNSEDKLMEASFIWQDVTGPRFLEYKGHRILGTVVQDVEGGDIARALYKYLQLKPELKGREIPKFENLLDVVAFNDWPLEANSLIEDIRLFTAHVSRL
jgi:hypothetical protein